MEDLGSPNAPAPNLVFWRTIIQCVLIPTVLSLGVGPHLNLPFQHAILDLYNIRRDPIQGELPTYLNIRRVPPSHVKGTTKDTGVGLGNRPHRMIQGEDGTSVLSSDHGEQVCGRTVA